MVEVSEVKQRVQQALLEYNSNPTQLASQFKVNQKTLNNHINGTTDMSVSTILLVLRAFPDLSAEWLLRGNGGLHHSESVPAMSDISNNNGVVSGTNTGVINDGATIGRLISLLEEKDKQINQLLQIIANK